MPPEYTEKESSSGMSGGPAAPSRTRGSPGNAVGVCAGGIGSPWRVAAAALLSASGARSAGSGEGSEHSGL
eukprot:6545778-Prorocentrum_lima.AAC.1